MGKKLIFQVGGAIVGAANIAFPLVIDLWGIFPKWPWQIHALIGFVIFAGFMAWIIGDKQARINKLEAMGPQLTIGQGTFVQHSFDERTRTLHIKLGLSFRNIGQKSAYQFSQRLGAAPDGAPKNFQILDERSCVNRLDPNASEFGQKYDLYIPYTEQEGEKVVPVTGVMIHCNVRYSNSQVGGKYVEDEWWFAYRTDTAELKSLSSKRKVELEPYVRQAYEKRKVSS